MMNFIASQSGNTADDFITFPFYKNGVPVRGAEWGLTLKKAGSMRFRWNETNPVRDAALLRIGDGRNIAQVELIHSKRVIRAGADGCERGTEADGILCEDAALLPVVTVADCVPIYFYEEKSGAFGVLHSGWKGTGIVAEAVGLLKTEFASHPEHIFIAIGPHIRECCYVVGEDRAAYFADNFSKDCIAPYSEDDRRAERIQWKNCGAREFRLSLEKANLTLIARLGIPEENVTLLQDCTCCNEVYGSNRRQTAAGEAFTVQAAFCLRTV
ncbi:MAG: polyphenol oxidase family protein [Treponema sp.]